MCAVMSCAVTFVMFDSTKENTPQFFSRKILPFFKILFSQQHPTCYKNGIITSIVIVKLPVSPVKTVPWGSAHTIMRTKRPNFFCHREDSLFLKSLFLTISYVLKEKTYTFQNKWRKTFWTPQKCSLTFIMCDTKRKIGQIFCSLERLPLSKTLCFQKLPGPKELILLLPPKMSKNIVDSYKMFPEVYHARFHQEKWSKNFCHRENLYFFKCLFLSIP